MSKFDDISTQTAARLRAPLRRPIRVYLSGPMRGYPEFNFPAFNRYAAKLREEGFEVFNPAEKDRERYGDDFAAKFPTGDEEAASNEGFSLREALAIDLDYVCREADIIAMLPGWENSSGARAELAAAEALGLRRMFLEEIK